MSRQRGDTYPQSCSHLKMACQAADLYKVQVKLGKQERSDRVGRALAEIVAKHGVTRINISALAKRAGVSRAWIYKYIGRDQSSMFQHFIEEFGRRFATVPSAERHLTVAAWIRGRLESAERFLEEAQRQPWILLVYFRHQYAENEIGSRIRQIESLQTDAFIAEARKALPNWDDRRLLIFAESYGVFRNAMVYRWLSSRARKKPSKKELLDSIESYLHSALNF